MNKKEIPMPLALLLLTAMTFLFGCTSPENEKTKTSLDVFQKKEIKIENNEIGGGFRQVVSVIDGDSTIFIYSQYTDRGEEGDGYKFVFTIPGKPDSLKYSPSTNEKLILMFGTGMTPDFSDTVKTYDFHIITTPSSIRISGQVWGKNISGTYIPK